MPHASITVVHYMLIIVNSSLTSSGSVPILGDYYALAGARLATVWSRDPHEFGSDVMPGM